MYNDFILVGPASDPARVDGGGDIVAALHKIAEAKAPFVARGDDSGTSKAELRFWKEAGIDPKTTGAGWYRDTGSGMGPTLNTAAAMDGYTLDVPRHHSYGVRRLTPYRATTDRIVVGVGVNDERLVGKEVEVVESAHSASPALLSTCVQYEC
jgi:ABC-type tungstate transport system permease subunit